MNCDVFFLFDKTRQETVVKQCCYTVIPPDGSQTESLQASLDLLMAHIPHTNNQSITYLVNDLKFSLLINRFMLVFSLIFLV